MEKHSQRPILIVEDENDIRETMKLVLELEGFVVLTASHGKEALDVLLHTQLPCVIFLDFMMPVMNGEEFLNAIKAEPKFSNIPVVMCSAAGGVVQRIKVDAFVKKPFEIDTVVQYANRYCVI
jgi:CheY-like chemotaxis protein